MIWSLLVLGSTPAALSAAFEARRAGLVDVLVIGDREPALPTAVEGVTALRIQTGTPVVSVEERPDDVIVESDAESFRARVCVDGRLLDAPGPPPDIPVARSVADRVRSDVGEVREHDVLVVGDGEAAVAAAVRAEAAGGRVVLAFTGDIDALTRLSQMTLTRMEKAGRLTILWRSALSAVDDVGGLPMAFFDDPRTPDLQFDDVVLAADHPGEAAEPRGRVYTLGPGGISPRHAWSLVAERHAAELPPLHPVLDARRVRGIHEIRELREEHYNATITHFDHSHHDLWVLRVRPDNPGTVFRPGQYATLGLGYWEPRVDDVDEGLSPERRRSLIRRSYSISSPVFDEHGYLADPARSDEIELYIVHVRPAPGRIPALTPRLADKRPGDRVYLGPKMAGRYTLDPVTDPLSDVVFLATGTGEAPHNAMITELLRKGHTGAIVSVVGVRRLADLAYADAHRRLESRFPQYRYITLPTREPGVEKRYIQDLVSSGELASLVPHRLDPGRTHVFLCGNPAMIGLPSWDGDVPVFPPEPGAVEALVARGFTVDRRGAVGNVHYEEYW